MPRSARARCSVAKRLERDGIGSATASRRSPGTPGGTSRSGTAFIGIGAIYHTVNPRLFPDQIAWIINHAEDRVMIVDLTFVPIVEKLARQAADDRALRRADRRRAHAGDPARNAVAYEEWIGEADDDFAWGTFDENTAAGMCYTSGTTGNPKGVVYSHRSNVLHSMMASGAGRDGRLVARRGHAGRADVPRQLLGARLHRADGRRDAGHAGRASSTAPRSTSCSTMSASPSRRPCRRSG